MKIAYIIPAKNALFAVFEQPLRIPEVRISFTQNLKFNTQNFFQLHILHLQSKQRG
jgi:hypothetical protein